MPRFPQLHDRARRVPLERRSVKGFLLAQGEARIEEMEKDGLLPKGK